MTPPKGNPTGHCLRGECFRNDTYEPLVGCQSLSLSSTSQSLTQCCGRTLKWESLCASMPTSSGSGLAIEVFGVDDDIRGSMVECVEHLFPCHIEGACHLMP